MLAQIKNIYAGGTVNTRFWSIPPTIDINGLPIHFDDKSTKIGVSLSGGADSTLMTYILCKHIQENNLKCKIYPFYMLRFVEKKPWLEYIVKDVWNWLDKKFPNILQPLEYGFIASDLEELPLNVVNPKFFFAVDVNKCFTDVLVTSRFTNYFKNKYKLEYVYSGNTRNPDTLDGPKFRTLDEDELMLDKVVRAGNIHPFALITKDWIMAQYKNFQILELLNLTRSCQADGTVLNAINWSPDKEYPPICGECFFCKERAWGIQNGEKYINV